MAKRINFEIKESAQEIKQLRKKQVILHKEHLLFWLRLLKENKAITREESCMKSGISLRTQERWIQKYISNGVEGLLSDAPNSKQSKIITSEIHQVIAKRVNSTEQPFLDYWDVQQSILSEFNVEIKYHWVRKYLIKHFKTKLESPRKSHYKKDDQAVNAFLKTP